MAKDRKKLQHIHSSIADKQPTPQTLEVGEIAVNNSKDQEFLSIKNTDDKVVRFSSDGQIINWIERKEVMPYEGYTRGADGPAGSTGPDSVTNNDLLQNKSNIIIKLNQVAASNTVKHDKVNGAKDIYGKCVNPTSDSGVTDGAGFAIDMSRYAMMDANPSFSSVTVSAQTNLSGNTIISNGASGNTYGTDTGHTLTIKTTDVTANDTNWTETITNRTSTVANETDKITTLNESATTRNTTVGTETLHVSGTTTETHDKAVTITNNNNVTETTKGNVIENISGTTTITRVSSVTEDNKDNVVRTTSGTTTETFKGQVTENNQSGYTINTTGNVITNTTGTTTELHNGQVTITNNSGLTETTKGNVVENVSGTTTIDRKLAVSENNQNDVTVVTSGNSDVTISGTSKVNVSGSTTADTGGNVTVTTSGKTTETKKDVVTENNLSAKTENTTGVKTENNSNNYVVNTTGNTTFNTTGSTTINSTGAGSDVNIYAKDSICEKADNAAAFVGAVKTNIGLNCEGNVTAQTLNVRANTADTRVTSAYINVTSATTIANKVNTTVSSAKTNITTATTTIAVANTSATTATLSGNTLDITAATVARLTTPTSELTGDTLTINESQSISAKTPTTTLSGTNLTINEANTVISSCTKVDIVTDDLNIKQCNAGSGTAEFDFCSGYTVNSNNITLQECDNNGGKIVIKENATDISGKTLTIRESGATNFSGGSLTAVVASATTVTVKGALTENVSGATTINHTGATNYNYTGATTLSGSSLASTTTGNTTFNVSGNTTVKTSGNTAFNTTGTTNVISTGSTKIETNGKNNKVIVQSTGEGGDVEVFATDTLCTSGGTTAAFVGATKTNIGMNCTDTVNTAALNVRGVTTNISAGTITQTTSGDTNVNVGGNLVEKITGVTTITSTGTTTIEATGANSDVCISATDSARVYGNGSTYVGVKCDGTIGSATTIEGTTLVLSGNTTNISGATTLNLSGKTVNVDATDIDVDASNNYCLSAATKANIYGKTTNIGVECGGTTATTINISGTTINDGGTTNNNNFTTINNTATTINNKASFNITGTTYISGNTTISGDVTIGDELTIPIPCNSITSTTVNNALCEILSRGAVTIEKNTSPADPQLATVYTVKQNGAVINTIEVAKDQFLQNAEVVKNTSGEWVIRLTWWIYDPDSGTHTTATTDVNASELVKDLTAVNPTDNGTAANHNVKVSSWYDSTSGDMKFSAETTPTMHVTNLYATTNVSASTVSGTTVKGATVSGTSVYGTTISGKTLTINDGGANISGNTTISGNTATIKGATVGISGGTTNISGSTAINISGATISEKAPGPVCIQATSTNRTEGILFAAGNYATYIGRDCRAAEVSDITGIYGTESVYISGGKTDVRSYSGLCVQASDSTYGIVNVGGAKATNIGYNCSGVGYSPNTSIYGEDNVTINSDYVNVNSKNISAYTTSKASNLKVNDADDNMSVVRLALNGADQALLLSQNKLCNDGVTRSFFTLRTNRKDDNQQCVNIQTFDTENGGCTCIGGGKVESDSSYTTGLTGDYVNVGFISKRDAIVKGKLWIEDNVCVTGTVTASGAIYSSDKNLKENIVSLKGNKSIFDKAADVDVVSFNFKDDENKNTKYGVIAQDVQKAGLDELVYENNGNLGVDYTSLLMLKIAYLEDTIKNLTEKIEKLENK